MTKINKILSVICIITIIFTAASCAKESKIPEKNKIYIQNKSIMSDDPKLDLSKLEYVNYISDEEYADDFPEETVLKTPYGDVHAQKDDTKRNVQMILEFGWCEYTADNGDVFGIDQESRFLKFDCRKRAYSSEYDLFFKGKEITSDQAIEKANEYVSLFVGEYVLGYLEPHVQDYDPADEHPYYSVYYAQRNPVEGYYLFPTVNLNISITGQLLILNNLASDVDKYENIPEGFAEKIDSLVEEWMSGSGVEYTYSKYKIKLLRDGRLAATGTIKPTKDGVDYQSISITVPIE